MKRDQAGDEKFLEYFYLQDLFPDIRTIICGVVGKDKIVYHNFREIGIVFISNFI